MRHASVVIAILFLLMPMVACSESGPNNRHIDMNIQDETLTESLKVQLEIEGISYVQIDATTLQVESSNAEKVAKLVNDIKGTFLPEGRHVSLPEAVFHYVVKQLDEKQVPYKVVELFRTKWLVWEQKETQLAEQIIDQVSQEHNLTEIQEGDFEF